MRKVALVSVFCLILMAGCRVHIPEDELEMDISLSFLHMPDHVASTTCRGDIWDAVGEQDLGNRFPVYVLQLGSRKFVCDYDLTVYDEVAHNQLVLSNAAREMLLGLRDELHESVFSLATPWKDADKVFPRMAIGEVLDLNTGLTFKVQRRGGTYHADVQPLSAEDTAVMKEIYGGTWSWDRRAIILSVDDQRIAASMNGMPHGQGALQNKFPGHFCIHFAGSITHGSREIDLGHMLMIDKAAGEIWNVARSATPEQQVRNLVAAFNQNDVWLTSLFTHPDAETHLISAMNKIQTINLEQLTLLGPAWETCEIELVMEVIYEGGQRYKHRVVATLSYIEDRWAVDPSFLAELSR